MERLQVIFLDPMAMSYQVDVKSGVQRGSVLISSLFYINDLPETLWSGIGLFADDTVIYLSVAQHQDTSILQQNLEKWEEK